MCVYTHISTTYLGDARLCVADVCAYVYVYVHMCMCMCICVCVCLPFPNVFYTLMYILCMRIFFVCEITKDVPFNSLTIYIRKHEHVHICGLRMRMYGLYSHVYIFEYKSFDRLTMCIHVHVRVHTCVY